MRNNIQGLIFKLKKNQRRKVNKAPIFFRKKNKIDKRRIPQRNLRLSKTILLALVVLLSISFVFGIGYLSYKYILSVRNIAEENIDQTVLGFNIPAYPKSEYIFENIENNTEVENFISLGNSVYRLPKGESISQVFSYYQEKLPTLGWSHVLSVPVDSESKMFGEYWIKDGKGMRIYSRLNDVWYQSITETQAQSGLEDVVKKETSRKLLLLTTEKTDLLPDFPWRLSYPTEYATNYYSTNIGTLQGVSFRKIGQENTNYIEPIGYNGANTFDGYIEKYLEQYNKKNKSKWAIVNSIETVIKGNTVVKATIVKGKDTGVLIAIKNEANTVIYIIGSFEDNDPFQNYILENIKPSILKP